MKHEPTVQDGIAMPILSRVRSEYDEMIAAGITFSINDLLSPDQLNLDNFCEGFFPHQQNEELSKIAEAFGKQRGIWLENAKHHVDCAPYLYPNASTDRMLTMMKNLVIGFHLNDTMGRDVFKFLSVQKQSEAKQLIHRMASLDEELIAAGTHPIEIANIEVLREFKESAPSAWFQKFLKTYCHHLRVTHQDNNAISLGYIPEVSQFIENRIYFAGVHHIVQWIEFSDGKFLDWDQLKSVNIHRHLRQLHWQTAAFGSLANDLFSFEKEIIDYGSDSNLVMILLLNHTELTLREAIADAAYIIKTNLKEWCSLFNLVAGEALRLGTRNPQLSQRVIANLEGIIRCIKATWLWHVHSHRYKRLKSIWKETMLSKEIMKGAA